MKKMKQITTYTIETEVKWNDIPLEIEAVYTYERETLWEPSHINIDEVLVMMDGYVLNDIIDDTVFDKIIKMVDDNIRLNDVTYI